MTDSASGGRTGRVTETPEARPLEPPQWRDHFKEPIVQPGQSAAPRAQAAPGGPAPRVEPVVESSQLRPEALARSARDFVDATPEERAAQMRQVGDKLKPLAADAEKLAAGALGVAAKGLSGLAARLEERRKQRG
ncbi:MAG: hypothetical protein IT337_08605 [Thermomicrobiales bacterium]|nr:hypothetical protein [Thermomicrobiales bacterium]